MSDIFEYAIRPHALNKGTNTAMRKIFEEWRNVIELYCAYENNEDVPYWYNERATLGSFAGAIWRANYHVLEEFSCTKTYGRGKEKADLNGRADLWFACGKTDNFICEVKQYWHSQNYDIKSLMIDATHETKTTARSFRLSTGLGLTFWVPFIHKKDDVDASIYNLIEKCKIAMNDNTIDMFCMVAIEGVREIPQGNDTVYPCVILLGKLT